MRSRSFPPRGERTGITRRHGAGDATPAPRNEITFALPHSFIEYEDLMDHTLHARQRSQQRAIPALVVDLLLQFGHPEPAGAGARKVYLDKLAHKRTRRPITSTRTARDHPRR